MQWLSLVTEDSSVQRLKADNRRPAVTPSVNAVNAATPAQPVRSGERSPELPRPEGDRHPAERRSGRDRRRRQLPVILDTRCNDRRQQPEDGRRPAAIRRINLYA